MVTSKKFCKILFNFLFHENSENEQLILHLPLNRHAEMFFEFFQKLYIKFSSRTANLVTKARVNTLQAIMFVKADAILCICYFVRLQLDCFIFFLSVQFSKMLKKCKSLGGFLLFKAF